MPRRSSLGALGLVFLTACSSPPPMTAAAYFPAVEAELARLDLATRDLTDRFAAELDAEIEALIADTDASAPDAGGRVLAAIVAVATVKMQAIIDSHTGQVEVFTTRVGELVPPEVVGGRHDELVAAFRTWAGTGEATIAQLAQAAELDDLAIILRESPFADAQLRVDEACLGLGDSAATVNVVLTCPGSELQALEVGS